MKKHAFPLLGFRAALSSLWKAPLQSRCEHCGFTSKVRLCPHCHTTLLVGLGRPAERIIAVVGNTNSGKSHYLTVLIERELKGPNGNTLGLAIHSMDYETEYLYKNKYVTPLFINKQAITANIHSHLIFRFHLPKLKQKPTLVLYDIAGELRARVSGDEVITNATRFLWNSSGIIYLVNPLDVDKWRPFLNGSGRVGAEPPDVFFRRILGELRMNKKLKTIKKIPIPLAVCISQFDRFYERRHDAGLNDDLFDPLPSPVLRGLIDHNKISKESDSLKDFMLRCGAENLVYLAEGHFAKVRFFATSALGSSPIPSYGAIPEVKPHRVDPSFLWLVSNLGKAKGA